MHIISNILQVRLCSLDVSLYKNFRLVAFIIVMLVQSFIVICSIIDCDDLALVLESLFITCPFHAS